MMSKKWWLPLLVVGVGVMVFQYLKATKPSSAPIVVEERVWAVDAVRAEPAQGYAQQVLYGQVVSSQRVRVSAPIAAQVAAVDKREGETFVAGERLLQLDALEVALSVQTAQAEFEEAKALLSVEQAAQSVERQREQHEAELLSLAKAEYERNRQLKARSLISDSVLDRSRESLLRQQTAWMNAKLVVDQHQAKLSQLQARLAKAQANDERAKLNAQRATVIAPYDGRVVRLAVSAGDQVSANTLLMEYDGFDHLEVRAVLPHRYRPLVEQALAQTPPLMARLIGEGGRDSALPVLRFGGQAVDAGVELVLQVPTALAYLRPGERVQLALDLPLASAGFALPYAALYGQDRVYVVEQGRLAVRQVEQIGEQLRDGERWALVRGELTPQDWVLVTHLPNAISGLPVQVRGAAQGAM
jgi:multidrug efflux pump subunit AcrA (membrane-fusion protein)